MAAVGVRERSEREPVGNQRLLPDLLRAERCLVRVCGGLAEAATQTFRLREQYADVRDRALVSDRFGEGEHSLERGVRFVDLLPPHPHDRDLELGATHRASSAARGPGCVCRRQRRRRVLGAKRGLGEHQRAERSCGKVCIVELACDGKGGSRVLDRVHQTLAQAKEDA